MKLFRWLRPSIPSPAPRPVVPGPPCWVLGCTEEAWARVGLAVPGLPADSEVCDVHDLAVEFNIEHPAIAGLSRHASAVAMGSEHAGWVVAGLFLVRPLAPVKASAEPRPQRPHLL